MQTVPNPRRRYDKAICSHGPGRVLAMLLLDAFACRKGRRKSAARRALSIHRTIRLSGYHPVIP